MKRLLLVSFSLVAAVLLCALPAIGFPSPLSVTTLAATNVSYNSATLSAQVNLELLSNNLEHDNIVSAGVIPATAPTAGNVYFLYGTSPVSLVYQTATQSVGNTALVTIDIRDLLPGTTYYAEAVANLIETGNHHNAGPVEFLTALLCPSSQDENLRCAGIGLQVLPVNLTNQTITGNMITFTTLIPSTPPTSSGGTGTGTQAATISNITVQSAAISTSRVSPGEQVTVTSNLINKGNSAGTSKITLYVNGNAEETKGVNLASGQAAPVTFSVSRSEPGTYDVYVNSVPAGSFTVDIFKDNDALIYGIIAAAALAIVAVLFFVVRKPSR